MIDKRLRRLVLELAREPGHPQGDSSERYTIIAPLNAEDLIDGEAWAELQTNCRVTRESPDEETSYGHLVREAGGKWVLRYDISNDREDENGFRFDEERFVPGEYISIERDDGVRVFRVIVAAPL